MKRKHRRAKLVGMIKLRNPERYTVEHGLLSPLNCPNCGAPVRGRECEYCGTVFSVGNGVDVAFDADAVGSAARRYTDSAERTVRHFNPETGRWEWVAEDPAKGVSTPALPTKMTR
jgi:hypothetical protein